MPNYEVFEVGEPRLTGRNDWWTLITVEASQQDAHRAGETLRTRLGGPCKGARRSWRPIWTQRGRALGRHTYWELDIKKDGTYRVIVRELAALAAP